MSEKLFETSDAANYRKLTEPLSLDEVNSNLKLFAEELYVLRNKYRIADLMFVVRVACMYDDGEDGTPMVLNHYGDSGNTEAMAAYAYGRASAERQENMMRLVNEGARAVKTQPKRK